ncbi:fatty acid desaturase-domain-containing protein [Cladochytrium replicatum]|nr:fatty acid desaturase-domain-containing protein [Cladochytrium replicatum]
MVAVSSNPPAVVLDADVLDGVLHPEKPLVYTTVDHIPSFLSFLAPLLKDPRDFPVLALHLAITLTLLPSAIVLCSTDRPSFIHIILHVAGIAVLVQRYMLGLHVQVHRPIFYNKVLNVWLPALAPIMGSTWFTYALHHLKMHHIEDNAPSDLSTTMFYQRDNFFHFCHYFLRFLLFIIVELPIYFLKKREYSKVGMLAFGELGVLFFFGWLATFRLASAITVFWAPFAAVRFGMMQGNWVQHSFLERTDPLGGGLQNAITVVASEYNERCFNDGYHACHHLNPRRHWTELPGDFIRRKKEMHESNAVTFKGQTYESVWWALMTHNYDYLASVYVYLGEGEAPSKEAIKRMLKEKTKKFEWDDLIKIYGKQKLARFGV